MSNIRKLKIIEIHNLLESSVQDDYYREDRGSEFTEKKRITILRADIYGILKMLKQEVNR